MKPLGEGSFLKSVLRVLGIDKSSVLPSLYCAEAKPSGSVNYISYGITRTALLEAEKAKGKAIMEIRRKTII